MAKFDPKTDVVIAVKDGVVYDYYIPHGTEITIVYDPEDEESDRDWTDALRFIEENNASD